MSLRGFGSLLDALASRPHLWLTAVRQTFALAPRGWWRTTPFLPIPAREYVSFRTHTQYGSSRREPEVYDVIDYLEWCRDWHSTNARRRG
ncbi:MAG: hypothetical protein ACKOFZ_05830 [Ilumatobacteraceae bacterium]